MKHAILIIFVLVIKFGYGQVNDKLHPKSIDFEVLESTILEKVNKLRDSLSLSKLTKDKILNKAALDHSDYQNQFKKLTHDQKRFRKESPFDRVLYYGGSHSTVGENVAFSYINKSVKLKNGQVEKNNTIESIAESLFQGWKHSPGHYANMINEDYFTTGINFSIDEKSNKIYATQVFGGKPYYPPKGVEIPKDAYGIEEGSKKLCDKIETYKYGSEFFANYLIQEGRDIYIYFHDLNYFKQILSGINDAIAIDVIEREQLPCDKPNIFHGNAVHDGVMLQPTYYYELYKNNKATQPNYLYSYLGTIPDEIKGEFQINTLMIKSNKLCFNSYPVSVPSKPIPLFKFIPLVDTIIDSEINPDTLDIKMDFKVPFERGEFNFTSREFKEMYNKIKGYKKFIKKIDVQTYSSVEGTTQQNIYLQEQRAKAIVSQIKKADLPSNVIMNVTSEENWKMFYEQVKKGDLDFLEDKTKEEVKAFFTNKNNLLLYDYALTEQRTASVTVYIEGIIDANKTNDLYDLSLAYQNKIKKKQSQQARAVMKKVISNANWKEDFPFEIFYAGLNDPGHQNLVTVNNQVALLLTIDWFTISNEEHNALETIVDANKNYFPLKYNMYCHLIKHMFYTQDSLVTPSKLLQEIKKLKIIDGWDKYKNQLTEEDYNRLILNYHLGALKLYRQNRNYEKVNESLQVIKEYFVKANMTLEEANKMALFFNEYYRFDWSIEILKPYIDEGDADEESIFTFVQTATLLRDEFPNDDYWKYMNMAQNKNKKRFCEWLNKDFQLLRYKGIKKVYCEVCE